MKSIKVYGNIARGDGICVVLYFTKGEAIEEGMKKRELKEYILVFEESPGEKK